MRNYSFDLTYQLGLHAERVVDAFFTGDVVNIEVKRDMRWLDTGNVFIETHCYYQESGKYEESGILTTRATDWVFVMGLAKLAVPADVILTLIKRPESKRVHNNNGKNPSWGNLLNVASALKYLQEQGRADGEI
jgi:hypothetical protein